MTEHDRDHDRDHDQDQEAPAAPAPAQRAASSGPDVPWGLVAFLIGAIVLTVFVLQNGQDTELRFLGWQSTYPLSFIIVLVVVVTVILDEILGFVLKRRRAKRRAEREELKRLRRES